MESEPSVEGDTDANMNELDPESKGSHAPVRGHTMRPKLQRKSCISRRNRQFKGSFVQMRQESYSDQFEDCLEKLSGSEGSFSSDDEFWNCDSDVEETKKDKQPDISQQEKANRVANELLSTEKTYVKTLHLLDQVFQKTIKEENEKQSFFKPEIIPQMFSNLESIYQFHSDFLLPKLEARIKDGLITKIGDVMKTAAPFFKLYAEFMNNFDNAMNVITSWEESCPGFAQLLNKIQNTPECNKLTLRHHMLCPIQRLPRYEMLLKDYIKHLTDNSEDLKDAKDALDLVNKATIHANEAMKNDKFHKLMEVNEKLGGAIVDLFTPTREFIKEGSIIKLSARKGIKHERYIFLFNDMLLVCIQDLLGKFRIKDRLDVDGMEVVEKDDAEYIELINGEEQLDIPDSFYVKSRKKIVQFCYGNKDEDNWCSLMKSIVEEFAEKRRSFIRSDITSKDSNMSQTRTSAVFVLGESAPKWVKDFEVANCMRCEMPFTTLRRRHHCRACGFVVCFNCCSKKMALAYDDYNMNKVCDACYDLLKSKNKDICKGYLDMSKDRCKTWKNMWFAVRTDFHLYYFNTQMDKTPCGCFNLRKSTNEELEHDPGILKLEHGSDVVYLNTKLASKRWKEVLKKMMSSELPNT